MIFTRLVISFMRDFSLKVSNAKFERKKKIRKGDAKNKKERNAHFTILLLHICDSHYNFFYYL